MKTLKDMAEKYPNVMKMLNDLTYGHTDTAKTINYMFRSSLADEGFTTTEASVRRWRRATMDTLDGSESAVAATESAEGTLTKGSPLNPLEALTAPRMKVLVLDIETSPILAYVWGTWKENVNHDMIVRPSEILCFAASWLDSKEIMFHSSKNGKYFDMLAALWALLDEADVLVTFYGKKFDLPKINTAFIINGFTPPSPSKHVDLCLAARSVFAFESNKLAYISNMLNTSGKLPAGGFATWKGCMENDPESWRKMELYNIQDVRDTKEVYVKMVPWLASHPSYAAFTANFVCPSCGSTELKKNGYYYTSVSKYPRFVCLTCGTWCRGTHRIDGAIVTGVAF